jgi:hypothetical protein
LKTLCRLGFLTLQEFLSAPDNCQETKANHTSNELLEAKEFQKQSYENNSYNFSQEK